MNSTTSRCEQHARVLEPIGVGIPTSAALLPQAYRLLSCEQFEQSATCAVRALCIDPASGFARLRRGLALSKAGRRREAPDQLARAVTPAHQDAQIRYKLAVACASDEIPFAAFLHSLLEQAQSVEMRVVLVCRPALVRLLRSSFPSAHVVVSTTAVCSPSC